MSGSITIVGFGPGGEAHITPAACEALQACNVCVGYAGYVEQVNNCFRARPRCPPA